jgi:hypothetical protein
MNGNSPAEFSDLMFDETAALYSYFFNGDESVAGAESVEESS